MVIRGEIRSKHASQYHNSVREVLIKAIPFDTEVIEQIECICSLFAKPIYTINQTLCLMSFFSRHLSATINLGT
jgi:hypothetical protein